ncbi:phosphotransferase [Pseudonocardia sp. ICBG601]|uniref:phosphotransferase n=1 Tax=Pseudonocardia sp. ICBG601 TaxID=2846759 RepID=UPI001CF60FB1|nr:phosphotransferase [Pseudonocardia sp. ICBG601]
MPQDGPVLTDAELAARTDRAVDTAVSAARDHGYRPGTPRVLHDLFSVVVALEPEPVVVRVPTVLPPGLDPAAQAAQQRREIAVCRWASDAGHPVVRPARPERPVAAGDLSLTFWERLTVVPDGPPDAGASGATVARLHAALRPCPVELDWMHPLDDSVAAMLDALRHDTTHVSPTDCARALREWATILPVLGDEAGCADRFPGTRPQPVHGDSPAYNVLRTPDGPYDADLEHVCVGPVEWDLTFAGPEVVAAYERAADRPVDAELLALCEAARLVQLVACFAMVPQQPGLGDGMSPLLELWRASEPCGGVLG